MKTTPYLLEQLNHRPITVLDIEEALEQEVHREVQEDGRTRIWGWVGRINLYLRVILLEDGETVLNAFPDSNFTRKRGRP